MKIGTYGPKVFTVSDKKINTFGSVSRSASYNVEEQENGTGKPKLKNKAPALETLSFSIELRSDSVDVRKEIESWIKLQGKSYYFIIGKEKYGMNKWELVGVDVSNQEFMIKGLLKSATISLNFKENVAKKKSTDAKQTRNTKG
jgi:hypothetical protein